MIAARNVPALGSLPRGADGPPLQSLRDDCASAQTATIDPCPGRARPCVQGRLSSGTRGRRAAACRWHTGLDRRAAGMDGRQAMASLCGIVGISRRSASPAQSMVQAANRWHRERVGRCRPVSVRRPPVPEFPVLGAEGRAGPSLAARPAHSSAMGSLAFLSRGARAP